MKTINNLLMKSVKERSGNMLISPSILSVKEDKIAEAISLLEKLNVPYLHLDVMDGKFVPNVTYDASKIHKIRSKTTIKLDTHLMIEKPENTIDEYILAGCDIITIHQEATTKVKELIEKIKSHNIKCGLSIKPNTPIKLIEPYLKDLDLVLVMSVEPGFGGQKFIEGAFDKIRKLNEIRQKENYAYLIEVDGGINYSNAKELKKLDVDLIVVGTYLMNSCNIQNTYEELKNI